MKLKNFYVNKQDEKIRLDKWFHRNIPEMPKILVIKLIRKGQVRIDGKRAKINTRVCIDQNIRAPVIEYHLPKKYPDTITHNFKKIKELFLRTTMYEDQNIIVFNKPYGLCVQDGSRVTVSIDRIFKLSNQNYHIVHRIDKETTGTLIVAKNPNFAAKICDLFKKKQVEKLYIAVLNGVPNLKSGFINSEIIIDNKKYEAQTQYNVIQTYENLYSLVELLPLTGRKHQIRAHCKSIECPILGDKKYYIHSLKKNVPQFNKLFLHSFSLKFNLNDKEYVFRAKIAEHFNKLLKIYFPSFSLKNYDL